MAKVTEIQQYGEFYIGLVDSVSANSAYFDELDFTPSSDTTYLYVKSPFGSNQFTETFIPGKMIDQFVDNSNVYEEHISELSYEVFECIFCMSGREQSLYTHRNSSRVHFHKSCYHDLCTEINSFVDDNKEDLVVQNI